MTDDILGMIAEPQRPDLTPDALLAVLRKGPTSERQLSSIFGTDVAMIRKGIDELCERGINLVLRGADTWHLARTVAPGAAGEFIYTSKPDHTFTFGISSDQHLCSKYERLDVLEDLYDWFHREGVDRVLNAGNWIDGDDQKTQHDVAVHGLEPQIDYLVANYPRRPGLTTFAVSGEDHEGWYSRREALDVGRFAERRMREAGRTDWVDLGFMESAITPRNSETGVDGPPILVMHPGGGSSYAVSYRPQKIVESLQGGEKPSVLIIGHYHKMSVNLFRSIWCIQAGCTQDQTPFMRKKGLDAHVGGSIVTLHQDPRTGAIVGCDVKMRQYFNRSYENGRWSKSGPVVHPQKTVVGR